MARQRAQKNQPQPVAVTLSPETKRGIGATVLLVVAAVSLLSLFNLAGPVGRGFDKVFQLALGWAHWLAPLLLAFAGVRMLRPQPGRRTTAAGVIVTTLAFLGLLQLAAPSLANPEVVVAGHGGGPAGHAQA
jgi:hypothetical protein